MEKEFTTYEIARRLKGLGFDKPCVFAWCQVLRMNPQTGGDVWIEKFQLRTNGNPFGMFVDGENWNNIQKLFKQKVICSAPLWQQALEFLREEGINICISQPESELWRADISLLLQSGKWVYRSEPTSVEAKTYEEVREIAIIRALDYLN